MKLMHIRTTAAAAAVAMLVLSGCDNDSSGDAPGKQRGDSGEKTKSTAEASQSFREQGLPIVEERLELNVVVRQFVNHSDFNQMEALRQLEESTNIALRWEQIPSETFQERKAHLFATGKLPNAFFAGLSSLDVVQYGSQGLLVPLEELVERYAPNIHGVLTRYPEVRAAITAPDGHIYALPFLESNDYMQYRSSLMINREWLDRLELPMPATTDEFYRTLLAFRDRDPNGNGLPDEIPLAAMFTQVSNSYRALFNAFGLLNPDGNKLAVVDGRVRYEPAQPGYREAIRYMHTLYSEGLMDEETFTQDLKRYSAKGSADQVVYGAFAAFLGDIELGSMQRLIDTYAVVPPLSGPDGDRSWRRQDNRIVPNLFSITSANRNPEATLRLIDAMNEEDTAFSLWKGPFGTHLSRTENGAIRQNALPENEHNLSSWIGKSAPLNYVPLFFTPERLARFIPDEASRLREEAYRLYKPYLVPEEAVYPQTISYTVEQANRLRMLDTDITHYVNRMEARWIVEGGVEHEWEDYLDRLGQMGLDEKLAIHQEAYARLRR